MEQKHTSPFLKISLEMGPLILFFIMLFRSDIMQATIAYAILAPISVAILWYIEKKIPVMPLVGAAMVVIAGGLTLWFDNETFIKMKPTVLYLIFAATLTAGLILKRLWLKILMGSAIKLQEQGWQLLTRNWIIFFVIMAVLNEIVWRNFSSEFWGGYKLASVLISLAFAISQAPIMMKYEIKES